MILEIKMAKVQSGEVRNIPATKDGATATLTKSQVADWKAAGWTVGKPKKLNQSEAEKDGRSI